MNYRTDFYPEDLTDADTAIDYNTNFGIGQTFYNKQKSVLDSVILWLDKTGAPEGNINVKVYATTGTYGTDGLPTGDALATSDNFDVTGIAGGGAATNTITFSGDNRITLEANTHYVFVFSALNTWTVLKCVEVATDSTTLAHQGNSVFQESDGGDWVADDTFDLIFYVMVDSIEEPRPSVYSGSSLSSGKTIKRKLTRPLDISKESHRWKRKQIKSR